MCLEKSKRGARPLTNDISMCVLFSFSSAVRIGVSFPSPLTYCPVAGVNDNFLCSYYFKTMDVFLSLIYRDAARTPPLIEYARWPDLDTVER